MLTIRDPLQWPPACISIVITRHIGFSNELLIVVIKAKTTVDWIYNILHRNETNFLIYAQRLPFCVVYSREIGLFCG